MLKLEREIAPSHWVDLHAHERDIVAELEQFLASADTCEHECKTLEASILSIESSVNDQQLAVTKSQHDVDINKNRLNAAERESQTAADNLGSQTTLCETSLSAFNLTVDIHHLDAIHAAIKSRRNQRERRLADKEQLEKKTEKKRSDLTHKQEIIQKSNLDLQTLKSDHNALSTQQNQLISECRARFSNQDPDKLKKALYGTQQDAESALDAATKTHHAGVTIVETTNRN